jgi:hypothetical protein
MANMLTIISNIINDNDPVCAAVVRGRNGAESLLAYMNVFSSTL